MRLTALLIAAFLSLLPSLGLAQTAAEIVAQNRDQIEKPSATRWPTIFLPPGPTSGW
jgi:hypothetical protein